MYLSLRASPSHAGGSVKSLGVRDMALIDPRASSAFAIPASHRERRGYRYWWAGKVHPAIYVCQYGVFGLRTAQLQCSSFQAHSLGVGLGFGPGG